MLWSEGILRIVLSDLSQWLMSTKVNEEGQNAFKKLTSINFNLKGMHNLSITSYLHIK